jgi:hypothetical protein
VGAVPGSVKRRFEMFIFHDIVDLFALFGLVRLGRVVWKFRHKSHS